MPAPPKLSLAAAAAALALQVLLAAADSSPSYLLISSPKPHPTIFYIRLRSAREAALRTPLQLKELTTPGQVQNPYGIAVDFGHAALYVADTGKIMATRLAIKTDDSKDLTIIDPPRPVVQGVDTKWITVDHVGNLYYSDTNAGQIGMIPAKALLQALRDGTTATASDIEIVFSQANDPDKIRQPQGVAVDNFDVMWANGMDGTKKGSIVNTVAWTPGSSGFTGGLSDIMASDEDSVKGVCLSSKYLFFTSATEKVYGTKIKGGTSWLLSSSFQQPRGCAWDMDGTVFVADQKAKAIYSFPSNSPALTQVTLKKVHTMTGEPYGLAVFSAASRKEVGLALLVAVLVTSSLLG